MLLFRRFRSLLTLAQRHRTKLILSGILSVLAGLAGLVPFVMVAELGQALLQKTADSKLIFTLTVAAVAAIGLRYVLMAVAKVLSHKAAFMAMYDVQLHLAEKIGRLPLGDISTRGSSTLKKTVLQDTDILHTILGHYIEDFLTGVAVPAATLAMFFYIDWRMALAALAALPLFYLAYRASFRNFAAEAEAYFRADEHMQESLAEYVNGITVIKAFNRDLSQGLTQAVAAQVGQMVGWTRKTLAAWSAFNVLADLPLLFILPAGLGMITAGIVSPHAFLLFLLLGIGYLQPLIRLSIQIGFLNYASKGIERIEKILYAAPLAAAANPQTPDGNTITVNNVSFAYGEHQALKDITLTIPEGSFAAIVGPSGSGKSTLAQLLGRFWDVPNGNITLGGVDLRQVSEEELYKRVAFVFQDVFLFSGSIADNLRMAKPDATDAEIIAAAQAARAHHFIMQMPGGYNSPVGEKGALLSGGQKQRISIARALLRNAPVLILDEATAYADPINESEIQKALATLMQGRTVIMIAHRLSTIRHADQIVLLDQGNLSAVGTHDGLLNSSTLYRTLWSNYTGAKNIEAEPVRRAS